MENGAPLVMAKATAVPLTWSFIYPYLNDTQLTALLDFWADDANYGAIPVQFTDPTNATAYFVHFLAEPSVSLSEAPDYHQVQVQLLEALGSYTPQVETEAWYGGNSMIDIENLAAGSDITSRACYVCTVPNGEVISAVQFVTKGTPAGVDDSNTVVLVIQDADDNIVLTKTWNAANQPPDATSEELTSCLNANYTTLAKGDVLYLSLTCGATANMPACMLSLMTEYLA